MADDGYRCTAFRQLDLNLRSVATGRVARQDAKLNRACSLSIAALMCAPLACAYRSTIASVLCPLIRFTVGRSTPA